MKHSTLAALAPLLALLRAHPALRETRPATFHLRGRDFVHFHEEPGGIFADALLAGGRVRLPASSSEEQAELMERLAEVLGSLERRERSRGVRKRTCASSVSRR